MNKLKDIAEGLAGPNIEKKSAISLIVDTILKIDGISSSRRLFVQIFFL